MGLVVLLVVLNHLPCDIQLSFMPNGYVDDVKYPVVFERCKFIYIHLFHFTIKRFLCI